MRTNYGGAFVVMASVLMLVGCITIGNQRDDSFENIGSPPRTLLLLVGGNSECSGNRGLWPIRDEIAKDFVSALAVDSDDLSTDYMAWTGDSANDSGCLPGNRKYLSGHLAIKSRLESYDALDSTTLLVVIGWSNGGATAAQLSEYLYNTTGIRHIDLLVTLDPVASLTGRPKDSQAKYWLNVYTSSSGFNKLRLSNIIAAFGGAWDEFDGPDLIVCMKGNHNEVRKMWKAVILPSTQFQNWVSNTRRMLGANGANLYSPSIEEYESC